MCVAPSSPGRSDGRSIKPESRAVPTSERQAVPQVASECSGLQRPLPAALAGLNPDTTQPSSRNAGERVGRVGADLGVHARRRSRGGRGWAGSGPLTPNPGSDPAEQERQEHHGVTSNRVPHGTGSVSIFSRPAALTGQASTGRAFAGHALTGRALAGRPLHGRKPAGRVPAKRRTRRRRSGGGATGGSAPTSDFSPSAPGNAQGHHGPR